MRLLALVVLCIATWGDTKTTPLLTDSIEMPFAAPAEIYQPFLSEAQ